MTRISYAYNGSKKAWFEFNGTFIELHEMMIKHLADVEVGEMHINPLGCGANYIDRHAPFGPDPEVIFEPTLQEPPQ